jgi:hypothetical protein
MITIITTVTMPRTPRERTERWRRCLDRATTCAQQCRLISKVRVFRLFINAPAYFWLDINAQSLPHIDAFSYHTLERCNPL